MAFAQFVSNFNLGLLAEISLGLLFMEVLLFAVSLFLILLVLVQRGKGGGLTGALGGMGGQSAFGSKAGDAFTKITVITAMIWIMLCMVTIAAFNPPPRANSGDSLTFSQGISSDDPADAEGTLGTTDDPAADLGDLLANPEDTDIEVILPGDSESEITLPELDATSTTEEPAETPADDDGN